MSPTILLWAQEEDHEELLAYNLIREGYIVSTVSSENEIVAQSIAINPDIILMGDCSTEEAFIEIVNKIKGSKLTSTPLVVCLTTKAVPSDDHPVCNASDACLALPAKPKKIVKLVRKLIKNSDTKACC
ncbi:MAG: hypothetical protein R3B47_14735 [Bacteroidia bacterium]